MPNLSRKAICKWFMKFRRVCSHYLKANPIRMEGDVLVDQVVEIDESIFGKKRKYNKGKHFRQAWVFGLTQKGTRKVSLHIVERRTKAVLIPIISEIVSNTACIYHDDWAAYRNLHEYGYKHGIVVHKNEFKSKEGVCTNTIEGIWGDLKTRIRGMHGVRMKYLPLYLDEYCYRFMIKDKHGSIFFPFLYHLALHW